MELNNKSILITGASSGIGKDLALALAPHNVKMTLIGRKKEALDEVAEQVKSRGSQAFTLPLDLTKQGAPEQAAKAAITNFERLDIVVNNAGNVRAGRLENATEAEIRAQIDLNVTAPILLSRACLPLLRDSGNGLIVNISSAIALVGMPFYTTYAATKAAIAHFGEALRRELSGEGVSILTVYPGATSTPMMATSKAGPEEGFAYEPPAAVANAIIEAIISDKRDLVRGGEKRMAMVRTNRDNPEAVDEQLAKMKSRLEQAVSEHSSI